MKFDYENFLKEAETIQNETSHILNKVMLFRRSCGLSVNSMKDHTKLHTSLMEEEIKELDEAIMPGEYADAIADIAVVAAGWWLDNISKVPFELQHLFLELKKIAKRKKINFIEAFNIVHNSNMSKLCYSKEEVKLTEKMHNDTNVLVEFKQMDKDIWACFCSSDSTRDDGKKIKKGKLLKSVAFKEPNWHDTQEQWKL